jgi:hypothetical protein
MLISKAKGLKVKPNFEQLVSILTKDSQFILNQEKMFHDIENASISLKKQIYTLKITENKRKLIFHNNILVNTKPFNVFFDKITNK